MNPNKCTRLTFIFLLFSLTVGSLRTATELKQRLPKVVAKYFIRTSVETLLKKKRSGKKQSLDSSQAFGVSPSDRVSVELEDLL